MKTLEDISPIVIGACIALLFFACEARAQEVTAYVADGVLYERYDFGEKVIEVPTSADPAVVRYAAQSDSLIQALDEAITAALFRQEAMMAEIQALNTRVAQLETRAETAEAERDAAQGDAQRYQELADAVRSFIERLR